MSVLENGEVTNKNKEIAVEFLDGKQFIIHVKPWFVMTNFDVGKIFLDDLNTNKKEVLQLYMSSNIFGILFFKLMLMEF